MVTDIYNMTGFLIRRLHQITFSVFEQVLADNDLDITPAQCAVLHGIKLYPDVDQATMAGLVAYDRATTGGIISRLCQKGYVMQKPSPYNHRSKVLEITREGDKLLAQLIPLANTVRNRVLAGLSPAEADEFRELLIKVTETSNHLSRAPLVIPPELAKK